METSAFVTSAGAAFALRRAQLAVCRRPFAPSSARPHRYVVPIRMDVPESEAPPAKPPAPPADVEKAKAVLLSTVADLDLGRVVLDDEEAQGEVERVISELEALNPTPDPADSPLRRAQWKLLYTTSPIVLGRGRPGFGRPDKVWQVLDMVDGEMEGKVTNIEEGGVKLFGLELRWKNRITGLCKALRGERIRLKFQKFLIGGFVGVPFPGPIVGWQDQTFLDGTLRIARTQYGNIFVMENAGDVDQ